MGTKHEARPHAMRLGAPSRRRGRAADRTEDHHPAGEPRVWLERQLSVWGAGRLSTARTLRGLYHARAASAVPCI